MGNEMSMKGVSEAKLLRCEHRQVAEERKGYFLRNIGQSLI